jgi:hypothetical protein
MTRAFDRVDIVPAASGGHTFLWTVNPAFSAPLPWKFSVQRGHTVGGPWETIASNVSGTSWTSPSSIHLLETRAASLFFRAVLLSGEDTYFSAAVHPYGTLGRRQYLIARDIIRQTELGHRQMAGIEVDVYTKAAWGARCPDCIDPVSGSVLESDCPTCLGTGRVPPYHGPYRMSVLFSPSQHVKQPAQDAPKHVVSRSILAVGSPVLKNGDILVDTRSGIRYIADQVASGVEIRNVPVTQTAAVNQLPPSDHAYLIGVS